ncbi:MAG: multidrug effflux MFS transporter [Rhodobacterales bacterium]|nr:multidrug effflux MFS transporter [Rhodobacterales bacterium]
MPKVEFIALIAMMMATVAFSIDSMLPALTDIGRELSPDDLNRAQLILTSFVIGMGLGTFFTGPLSDAFGRKPVILVGAVIYIAACVLAWAAPTLELVLAARVVMGLGVAAPRIVGIALVRDLYAGREMARIMSFAMMIFTLVPAVAPLLGTAVIAIAGWRGIFVSFIQFSTLVTAWLWIRLDEPLAVADRRPLKITKMKSAIAQIFRHPTVRITIAVQALSLGMLFTSISMIQQVFDISFGRAESFPLWFAGIALVSGTASLLNAALVMRLGMRRLVSWTLGVQIIMSGVVSLLYLSGLPIEVLFYVFIVWQVSVFFQAGMTLGNLNAMAMEPMGHIAGMAASIIGGISTVLAAAMAIPVGLMFDGTPLPLTIGVCIEAILAFALMMLIKRIEARVS